MRTIDLKKQLAPYYKQPKGVVSFLTVPKLQYLMVDGTGDPNGPDFAEAVGLLYSLSYTMKFMFKKGKKQIDYPVMPLQGLWWSDDMNDFLNSKRERWRWTAMILQPDIVTPAGVEEAIAELKRKKKQLPGLGRQRLDCFDEGLSAQILHIGPYSAEAPNIQRLHEEIKAKGYALRGKHHEIYIGDPHRSKPEALKTIIRQPCR